MNSTKARSITRTRFTWLAYGMLGFFAYNQASMGPLMPFVRDELALNYTLTGLHLSMFALGMSIAGRFGDAFAQRLGRYRLFWGGGAGMAFGALLLTGGQTVLLTLLGSFCMGLLGNFTLIMVQSTLSDQFGERRTIALTEANVAASVFATLAPLVIGLGVRLLDEWRWGLWLSTAFFVLAFLFSRRIRVPQPDPAQHESAATGKLSGQFWLLWWLLFMSIATEWCLVFWAPDFLVTHVQFSAEAASTAMSLFFAAMILGRILGSRLSFRYRPLALYRAALALLIGGFLLFWQAGSVPLHLLGLFLSGFAIANLFPMGLSAASEAGMALADRASSRISLAAGLSILIVPQVLGTLADQTGIFVAFGVVLILLLLLIGLAAVALLLERRTLAHLHPAG